MGGKSQMISLRVFFFAVLSSFFSKDFGNVYPRVCVVMAHTSKSHKIL